ncbi:TM0106 family RecB-like putative nuclease [Achromobacter sp.]|uniref:TM0106 family RecB-like putative nuclease n=1 Tax=Achromobacter sp. TaxID=134375 RepID=UPI0028AE4100|nr:TM0106 family RecB-like putative nuclease [Achromobacter sp.]
MQKSGDRPLFSASDVVGFLECEHLTTLDLLNLETPLGAAPQDEQLELIQQKGLEHERAYLERLRDGSGHPGGGPNIIDVSDVGSALAARVARTREAMASGADVIYQAAFTHDGYVGHADFLLKTDRPSRLGDYSYEATDTKLARSPRVKFVIQLSFYSWLLSLEQGAAPLHMHVVLGSGRELALRVADYAHYFRQVMRRFEAHVAMRGRAVTYPDPCEKCAQCHWNLLCKSRRADDDHLSLVANITRQQIRKLNDQGIRTLAQLGTLASDAAVARLEPAVLHRLRSQAALQLRARTEGGRHWDLVSKDPGDPSLRGFERMPQPNPGDMYFDMEGDPLEEGGLEYLFGLYVVDDGAERFIPFWAHNRGEEKQAFEAFIDYVVARLQRHPDAHIYHYAPYEATALKKMMSVHATREAEVDNLLRLAKLVDLYQVVREGVRVSEPGYSIKNIEHFYLDQRAGDVTNAGASIVYYERWKRTGEARLLQDIEDYNRDDVVSTYKLHEWLCGLRPAGLPWSNRLEDQQQIDAARFQVGEKTQAELRLEPYRAALLAALPADELLWSDRDRYRALVYQLLDFHRREQKPEWWAMFARMEATDAELVDDNECLGALVRDESVSPEPVAQSLRYTYRFPAQQTKLRTGSSCTNVRGGPGISRLTVDPAACVATFTMTRKETPPARLSLGPGRPVKIDELANALFRYGDALLESADGGGTRFRAVDALLKHEAPRIAQAAPGGALVDSGGNLLDQVVDIVGRMDETTLFLQGPPGAGKTYTGSRVLVHLLRQGKRIAVTSNSHHAINNLLDGLENAARQAGFSFAGAKKSGQAGDDSCFSGEFIEDVFANDKIDLARHQLVAGTAWLFSRADFEQKFDYLFVDEAGQVSLANLVAMGQCARNIVLLGDQMQLGQPTKGTHPGRSGESTLEYLLDGHATIAADRGIFLDTSYRMHPAICGFISDAIYDGRLLAAASTHGQGLVLDDAASALLSPSGIRYVPVEHEGNAQSSDEEARVVADLYASLMGQRYRDKDGRFVPITAEDVLIVAPYNVQVNTLKQALPEGARVGTVDKFQGQEAQVVIISMATSSGDTMPRDMEFLFSRNRLNVAVSRAKSLAILVASPALLSVRCQTPEQMALVNTLCWVAEAGQKE